MRVIYLSAKSGRRRVLDLDSPITIFDELAVLMRCSTDEIAVRPIDADHFLIYCVAHPTERNDAFYRLHWDLCWTGGDACIARRDGQDISPTYTPFRYDATSTSPLSFFERLFAATSSSLYSTQSIKNGTTEEETGSGSGEYIGEGDEGEGGNSETARDTGGGSGSNARE